MPCNWGQGLAGAAPPAVGPHALGSCGPPSLVAALHCPCPWRPRLVSPTETPAQPGLCLEHRGPDPQN